MEARSVRVAGLAVLLTALCFGLHAGAATFQAVRLEPARLFNPDSESLLGALRGEIRGMSFLARGVFNLAAPDDYSSRGLAYMLLPNETARAESVNLEGISREQTYVPQLHPSDVPLPQLSAPADAALSVAAQTTPAATGVTDEAPQPIVPVRFGSYSAFTPATQVLAANVSVPVRVGSVHFNGVMGGLQEQSLQSDAFRAMQICGTTDENAACPYLRDSTTQSLVAGTNFNVRAGNSNVNLQLSSTLARLSSGDSAIFPYVPVDPDAQLNGKFDVAGPDASILQYPGLADVVKTGVDARLAVPVTNRITVGLQYDRAHYQGDYGNAQLPDVDAYKNTYQGNVSYQLPNTNSMLTLSARQYRYQDTFSPFSLTQTRADVNFTVKF